MSVPSSDEEEEEMQVKCGVSDKKENSSAKMLEYEKETANTWVPEQNYLRPTRKRVLKKLKKDDVKCYEHDNTNS